MPRTKVSRRRAETCAAGAAPSQVDTPQKVFVCPVACCARILESRAGIMSHLRSGSDRHLAAVEQLVSESKEGYAAFWKRLSCGEGSIGPSTVMPVHSVVPATQERLGRLKQPEEQKQDRRSGNRGAATRKSYTARSWSCRLLQTPLRPSLQASTRCQPQTLASGPRQVGCSMVVSGSVAAQAHPGGGLRCTEDRIEAQAMSAFKLTDVAT